MAPPPTPAIGVSSPTASLTIVQGEGDSATITVSRQNGFAGAVQLSVGSTPAGVTAALSPTTLPPGVTTAALSVNTSSLASAGTFSVTVTAQATGVAARTATFPVTVSPVPRVALSFCPGFIPAWIASQNGDGPWVRAVVDADNVARVPMTTRGAVAYVFDLGPTVYVFIQYGTPAELVMMNPPCPPSSFSSKQVSGTIAGMADGQDAIVSLGTSRGYIFAPGPFEMFGVPAGTLNLVGVLSARTDTAETPLKLIVRRGLNLQDRATLPTLDFAAAEAVQPAAANLTIVGRGPETPLVYSAYTATDGSYVPMFDGYVLGPAPRWYGMPSALLATDDLHRVNVEFSDGFRTRIAVALTRSVRDVNLTVAPYLAPPTVSIVANAPYVRPRIQRAFQSEYGSAMHVAFYQQPSVSESRAVTVDVTSGYRNSSAAWDIVVPDFTSLGFNPAWGFRQGAPFNTNTDALGGVSLLDLMKPADGQVYRVAYEQPIPPSGVLANRAAPALRSRSTVMSRVLDARASAKFRLGVPGIR